MKILTDTLMVSALLYIYYFVFLRNTRLHQFNRIYLITSLFLTLLSPFLNIPIYSPIIPAQGEVKTGISGIISTANNILGNTMINESGDPAGTTQLLFLFIYLPGCMFCLVRIGFVLNRIKRLLNKYPSEQRQDMLIVKTRESDAPFSFFKWLFWNTDHDISSPISKQILRHESVHIRQRHSIDVLFSEIVFAFFWINPFIYFIKRELKIVHEFSADAMITDKPNFARLLLSRATRERTSIAHNLSGSSVGRRITMLTGNFRHKNLYLKVMSCVIFSLLTLVFFSFDIVAKEITGINKSLKANNNGDKSIESTTQLVTSKSKSITKAKPSNVFTKPVSPNISDLKSRVDTLPSDRKKDAYAIPDEIYLLNYRDNSVAREMAMPANNKIPAFVAERTDKTQILIGPDKNSLQQVSLFYPAKEYDELVLIFKKRGMVPLQDGWSLKVIINDEDGKQVSEKSLSKEWITGYEAVRIVFHDLPKGIYQLQILSSDKKYSSLCMVIKDYEEGVG